MKRISHDKFLEDAMSRPGVVTELKKIENEFKIYEDLIKARLKLGKTQEEIARAMHTSVSAVGRLETGSGKVNPTLDTLRKYANALGLKLQLRLVK